MDITRFLPNNQYQAAINANAPTAANPFATILDLVGLDDNIYNTDGTLTGNRTVQGGGNNFAFQNLGDYAVNMSGDAQYLTTGGSINFVTNGPNTEVISFTAPNGSLNFSSGAGISMINNTSTGISIRAFGAGNLALDTPGSGRVTIEGLTYPDVDGSANYVMITDGSAVLSFVDVNTLVSNVNVYNSNGTLTGNRIINGGGFQFQVQNASDVQFTASGGVSLTSTASAINFSSNTAVEVVNNNFRLQSNSNIFNVVADGALGATHTATFQPSSGVVAYLSDIPAADGSIYDNDGTIGAGRIATITDTLSFTGGEISITTGDALVGTDGFYLENSNNDPIIEVKNNGNIVMGTARDGSSYITGSGDKFVVPITKSNGAFVITNADPTGGNNTTADNSNFNFTTRNDAGAMEVVAPIFVRNRSVAAGSAYGVMVINEAIQTENSTGTNGRTVISTRNRHTSGAAPAVLEVENRDLSGSATTFQVSSFLQNTQLALAVRSGSAGTADDTWNWRLFNNHEFTHNFGQLATGDFIMRGATDLNLFRADASTDRVGIGTATVAGGYKLGVLGAVQINNGAIQINMATSGGMFINAGANTNTQNFGVSNSTDGQYFVVTSSGGNGRVGVNKVLPNTASRLHVGGAIHSDGAFVTEANTANFGTLNSSNSAPQTWTLPNATGTIALDGDWDSGETYIVSNDNTVRTIDANNITGAVLRDVVCTLIRDLNTAGVLTV